MAKLNGFAAVVEIETGSPASYKPLANQTTLKLSESFDDIDVTDKTSGTYGDFLSGLGKGDLSFEFFYNTAPANGTLGYKELRPLAGPNKAPINVRIRVEEGATDTGITFQAILSSVDLDATNNQGMKVSGSFKLRTEPVIGTAA